MLNVIAAKPGIKYDTSNYHTSQHPNRNGPSWKTIVKAVVIVVAVAVAIYVGKTVILPMIAEWAAKAAAAVETVATATTGTALKAHATAKFVTTAVGIMEGQALSVGGAASSGVAAVNTARTMLKPIQILKIVFEALGNEVATETTSVPFAAAGGGGFAW